MLTGISENSVKTLDTNILSYCFLDIFTKYFNCPFCHYMTYRYIVCSQSKLNHMKLIFMLLCFDSFEGWDYNNVIKVRWVSGTLATVLCYPALLNLGISSHFLPWLPAAIALYSAYGVLLSYKKYKVSI